MDETKEYYKYYLRLFEQYAPEYIQRAAEALDGPYLRGCCAAITYCYNGERFVSKYFDAILVQNYDNIELILFNNGSVDNTGKIAEDYKLKLEARRILVNIIHYKENQSTCQLKQDAFHMMHGEGFFGCDSDDLIDPLYISTMVSYLQNNPEKGIVYCQLRVIEEETGIQKSIMTYANLVKKINLLGHFIELAYIVYFQSYDKGKKKAYYG